MNNGRKCLNADIEFNDRHKLIGNVVKYCEITELVDELVGILNNYRHIVTIKVEILRISNI